MSGGGGFDPGKDLANLDKDLGLSKNAPLIAAATAMYFTGGAAATGAFDAGIGLDAMAGGAGMAIPVETAIPTMVEGVSAAAPIAEAAAPAAAASAVPTAVAPVAEAGGITNLAAAAPPAAAPVATAANPLGAMGAEPGVGGAPWAATNAAAAPAQSGVASLFDKATTAYGKLPDLLKYGIPLTAAAMYADRKSPYPTPPPYDGPLNKLKYDPDRYRPTDVRPPTPYTPVYKDYRNMAGGGFLGLGDKFGDELEKALFHKQNQYATPPLNYDPARYDAEAGTKMVARPGMAGGGLADLGGYADYAGGGRMLKGPGDGMSDSIPAVIAGKQPARLANDEFVVPADVVSHLGNGSSDAGAKQLYRMMDKVRAARTGKQAQAKQINPNKYMPA
jgi:hypothetical protein